MKKIIYSFITSTLFFSAVAQVPKKVIVEHFTNTLCSICASRNPGFYTNYFSQNQSNVLHLAVHPSSPYSACQLNLHNKPENDARTNYYGVYGGTPRLVIQGVVIPASANYNTSSLFTPYLGQTSPASIKITQTKFGNDSIRARVVIKTEATHSLGNLRLFVALAEDTLNYSAPNGEQVHHDVFRKSLTGATGMVVNLPVTVGDSIVFTGSSLSNPAWVFSKIYTMAILQEEANKAVVQCEAASSSSNVITGLQQNKPGAIEFSVYPNPATDKVKVKLTSNEDVKLEVFNALGAVVYTFFISGETDINLSNLSKGTYLIRLSTDKGQSQKTIIKN